MVKGEKAARYRLPSKWDGYHLLMSRANTKGVDSMETQKLFSPISVVSVQRVTQVTVRVNRAGDIFTDRQAEDYAAEHCRKEFGRGFSVMAETRIEKWAPTHFIIKVWVYQEM